MGIPELRIGLIIKQGIIDYIEANDQVLIHLRCNGGIVSNPEPEILTEEWLLRFGFNQDKDDSRSFQKECMGIVDDDDIYLEWTASVGPTDDNCCVLHYPIKYVHQIQNLYFALTGEELTIDA